MVADKKPNPKERQSSGLRQVGLLTAIPTVMVAGLLVGFFFGSWVDKSFNVSPWGKIILSILGIIAGFKQTIGLIKEASEDSENEKTSDGSIGTRTHTK